jgi:hypothetical protein
MSDTDVNIFSFCSAGALIVVTVLGWVITARRRRPDPFGKNGRMVRVSMLASGIMLIFQTLVRIYHNVRLDDVAIAIGLLVFIFCCYALAIEIRDRRLRRAQPSELPEGGDR